MSDRYNRTEAAAEVEAILTRVIVLRDEQPSLAPALSRVMHLLGPLAVVLPTADERLRAEHEAQERQRLRRRAELERRIENPRPGDRGDGLRAKWLATFTAEERRAMEPPPAPAEERLTVGAVHARS